MTTHWVELSPIIERLAAIDLSRALVDHGAVQAAVDEHLDALRLQRLRVRWVVDAEAGCLEGWRCAYRQGVSGGRGAARHQPWKGAISAAFRKAKRYRYPADHETLRYRLPVQILDRSFRLARARGPVAFPDGEADNLALLAAILHADGRFLEPLVRAYEAGLWLFWVTQREIVAAPRPAIRMKDGRLHSEAGPAVSWAGGTEYWALHGVEVPADLATTPPERLDARVLLRERNAEVRKEIVRRIGIGRVFETLGGTTVDREGDYELVLLRLGEDARRPFLRMRNPSTGDIHLEGVPPETRCVREALAWRNNGLFGPPERLT